MEEIGFKRKDKNGKMVWRNDLKEKVIFDDELKSVEFKDEISKPFPVSKELLVAVLKIMEEKNY